MLFREFNNPVRMNMWDKRFYRGEFMYAEENTMDDVREPYMMAVTCPMGGHQNIL